MKNAMIESRHSKHSVSPQVQQYLQASLSENTRRAYSNDLAHFVHWGGRIPATPECVASYLAVHANQLSYATLSRRVVAIGKAHILRSFASPAHTGLVKATLHGIRRTNGSAQRRVAPALLHDVRSMVTGLRGMKGMRDKALLLVGFAGALRRSELVSIRVENICLVKEGLIIRLLRGKTDQVGQGRDTPIPFMRGRYCPVKAVKDWLAYSGITEGNLFRRVNRYGQVMAQGLSAQSVALIVKQRAESVGLDARHYSGHSLRAGLVTSAAKCGVSEWKICRQTGHKSEAVMQRYIRDGQLFKDHLLGKIW